MRKSHAKVADGWPGQLCVGSVVAPKSPVGVSKRSRKPEKGNAPVDVPEAVADTIAAVAEDADAAASPVMDTDNQ